MTDVARLSSALADRYRVERELGEGGMATVYLAHDVRHSRRVALKVLRPDLAAVLGAERFLAEIRTTASLQHPHILPLFDSGQADGFLFYVMPYVEGESLRARLNREKQLPIADAVRVATEVAGALDYAHRHHVIHRDIKPENILLHDGQALVADFGIALAVSQAGAGSRMTETGLSLGTPHYMSPEQAMGERELTARSDVYALGAMTYEMLVGEPPFTGPTAQAILAKVVTTEPEPLVPQRKTIPPEVEAAVLTALEKLPADRFSGAAEFAAALAGESPAGSRTMRGRAAGARSRASRAPGLGAIAGLALLAAAAGAGAWAWLRPRLPAGAGTMVLSVPMPSAVRLGVLSAPAVSPQGTRVAFVAADSLGKRLFVRDLGSPTVRAIPGTEGADGPFFSPDGRWVAFASGGSLRKVDVTTGGAPEEIAGTAGTVDPGAGIDGGAWGSDGTILYAPRYRGGRGLLRVPATGGAPAVAALPDSLAGYIALARPQFLPGGRNVLCGAWYRGSEWRVGVVSLETGRMAPLVEQAVAARYGNGRLVFARQDGTLYAAPFDPARGITTGPAVRLPGLDGLIAAGIGLSDNGLLSYVSGTPSVFRLATVDRRGAARPLSLEVRRFDAPRVSPDGRRIAVGAGEGGDRDIWVLDRNRGTLTRLTFDGDNIYPAWSPDGHWVAAGSHVGSTYDVLSFAADGTGAVDTLVVGQPYQFPGSWSPDQKWFVYLENSPGTNEDIFAVSLDGRRTRRTLAQSRFTEVEPVLSPDGRWLAYVSDETGRREVYVRPFAEEPGKWQVSTGGGDEPAWARSGRELFYRTPTRLMAVPIRAGAGFAAGEPAALFDDDFSRDGRYANYDLLPGDSGFVMLEPTRGAAAELRVVVDWEAWANGQRPPIER